MVLLFVYVTAVALGVPALWLAAQIQVSSLGWYLLCAICWGLCLSTAWLVWQLSAGTTWVKVAYSFRDTSIIFVLAAVSGAITYWCIAIRDSTNSSGE